MVRYVFALLLAMSCLVARAAEPLPAELPPDQEAAAIRTAEMIGLAMYRHDRAAAVATDAARKIRAIKEDKRVKGWITEERDGGIVVTLLDTTPAALYRATVSDAGELTGAIEAFESPQLLTESQSGAAAARALAMTSGFQPCSDKYNSVVLPAHESAAKKWDVYLLPATTKNDVVPIGGTYRVETDGHAVISHRGFTRTCIALQNGPQVAGLMITHLLDPTPTEAHVFWSLWAKKAMYVATPPNGTIWSIEGGKIRLVKRGAAKS